MMAVIILKADSGILFFQWEGIVTLPLKVLMAGITSLCLLSRATFHLKDQFGIFNLSDSVVRFIDFFDKPWMIRDDAKSIVLDCRKAEKFMKIDKNKFQENFLTFRKNKLH